MKKGDLIAVNGMIYEYEGIQESGLHKVYDVEIDAEGILTRACVSYFTDEELSNRGIDLTNKQWIGLTKHFLRKEYVLPEEKIKEIAIDIVRCFPKIRAPLVEELPMYIALYMD